MLSVHTGADHWHVISDNDGQLFQLKMRVEKLMKDGKLETMAPHLPGARHSVPWNEFKLLGENMAQLCLRLKQQSEKEEESGLSAEEVEREFSKKLDSRELAHSSYAEILLNLNKRFTHEYEHFTNALQGLNGVSAMGSA